MLDTGEYEGTPFMVFDFIPAGSLADQMALQPLTSAEAMAILNGIAKGLDHAHKHGIIHRDVKPANVLLNTSGAPVIADFGLARLLEQPSATATGMFAGTPAYMSPEQAEGGEVGPRADQYSLAALAYELLAGQVPFPGDTVSEVLTALLTREPVPPSTIRPGLSAGVDKAILRGLSKKPENRWPTCQALDRRHPQRDGRLGARALCRLERNGPPHQGLEHRPERALPDDRDALQPGAAPQEGSPEAAGRGGRGAAAGHPGGWRRLVGDLARRPHREPSGGGGRSGRDHSLTSS